MAWGIDFTADIFLIRQDYNKNISQVEYAIEEIDSLITKNEKMILMYCSSDLISYKEDGFNVEDLYYKIEEILNELREMNVHLYQLNLYKEHLQEDSNKQLKIKFE